MSADNWDVCPRCLARHKEAIAAAHKKAEEAYGKLPRAEYEALVQAAMQMSESPDLTLREDWELGTTSNGEFFVIYHARCEEPGCGFAHEFKHEEKVKINA